MSGQGEVSIELVGVAAMVDQLERQAQALLEAARDYREHVHDEHPNPLPGSFEEALRDRGDAACAWLERRADLIGADHGRPAIYDPETKTWRDQGTGESVPSEPDAAWIAGGDDHE